LRVTLLPYHIGDYRALRYGVLCTPLPAMTSVVQGTDAGIPLPRLLPGAAARVEFTSRRRKRMTSTLSEARVKVRALIVGDY